jgi:hypothetical protein
MAEVCSGNSEENFSHILLNASKKLKLYIKKVGGIERTLTDSQI